MLGVESAVVDEDAVLDDRIRLELRETCKRIQHGRAVLIAGERALADEDGPGDGGGHGVDLVRAHIVPGGQVVAGNAVVLCLDKRVDEVGEPAVVNVVRVRVLLHCEQLLAPIDARIGEVFVGAGGAAESLVAVRDVVGIGVERGAGLPKAASTMASG